MAKTLYATCPLYHWGEVPTPVPDLKTHTLWCKRCGREADPQPFDPVAKGWDAQMKTEITVTED
jgi:hypothetical protein